MVNMYICINIEPVCVTVLCNHCELSWW